jgi:hypothetical protein
VGESLFGVALARVTDIALIVDAAFFEYLAVD